MSKALQHRRDGRVHRGLRHRVVYGEETGLIRYIYFKLFQVIFIADFEEFVYAKLKTNAALQQNTYLFRILNKSDKTRR